ncbi:helix-turn-helix transcriptional regulator [Ruegeria sp.]|uniref:helix-turn-helix domain-containing protein n=1 Tax=Ruegeria sp. TaxID=1879320 RepID=UPI002324E454|nr:helix-turn-helix transcriptional regulator [Ruegeria sp.]MDA7966267.1 helix-turn-helix domain-containing protein [Ruegeria sp.]
MAGTVHTQAYKDMLSTLISLRKESGLSQADLAERIGKPASFVGKYELGERRLDAVELLIILRELSTDFEAFWARTNAILPQKL